MTLLQILTYLRYYPALGAGGFERQGAEQLFNQLGRRFESASQLGLCLSTHLEYREVVRQQLLQYQPLLGRMLAAFQQRQRYRGGRAMQQLQGGGQFNLMGIESGGQQLLHAIEV